MSAYLYPHTTTQTMAPPAICITVVKDPGVLGLYKDQWNALVERHEASTIFQTFEWHASWWSVFGRDAQMFVLLAEAEGELVGIAPLMVSHQWLCGRKQRVVEFIGVRSSDYCDFIVDPARPDVLPRLLLWLAENDHQWDVLRFYDVSNTASIFGPVPEFFDQHGYATDTQPLYEAATRLFDDPDADQHLPRKKSLRRHYNHFARSGQLEFQNYTSAEDITAYLDTFFQQHIARRALTDAPSLFLDERQRLFYQEIVHHLTPTGRLLFSVVLFNQTPIAFHLGFEYKDRLYWYKPAFNVEFAKHSPGEVLIKYLLEYALDRGVAELDFTIGEEPFKYRFANHRRVNHVVHVFRHRTSYRTYCLWMNAKAFIKRKPQLARFGRTLLQQWKDRRIGLS